MKYMVYEQRAPIKVPDRYNPESYHWEANIVKVGEIHAEDSEQAFVKAKAMTIRPILESDESLMTAREERAKHYVMNAESRYS